MARAAEKQPAVDGDVQQQESSLQDRRKAT
jgi:hypothetical protein